MSERTCPVCRGTAFPWARAAERVIDRCDSCGAGIGRDEPIDLDATLAALSRPRPDGSLIVQAPNRASLQAGVGREAWAALAEAPGGLLLTPRSLELVAERTGHTVARLRFPRLGRNQTWMWQTLLNGLTFNANFAREARAGRLRPASARGRLAFAIDLVVTVLAAPLVARVAVPLELGAALAGRGGLIEASLGPSRGPAPPVEPEPGV